jgi:hypothetical protein
LCPDVVAAPVLSSPEDYSLVLYPLHPAFEDEVIQVRQRLGERETPLMEGEGPTENDAGDLVRGL